ncbi:hypothetical protein DFP72DRAFT_361566 [Ephemerocybe angulata]|uniref:Uncharacterized protein n=1 Tax=Ephemerocybe angulata TaxID=980116 RepID=A0A8H6M814_9AGAR|nr:hypothetical protein DFP72DRAFT_361566 [Tulosesus angulatus]
MSSSSASATKSAALKSAKYKAITRARLRRRRQGIDLGEAGLGPNRIRGASRLREGIAGTPSSGNHILQGAENFVLGDVDIIAAGGNVERHRHEHVHVHIHVSTGRRRRSLTGDRARQSHGNEREYATAAEPQWRPTNVGRALHSTSGADDPSGQKTHHQRHLYIVSFFFF